MAEVKRGKKSKKVVKKKGLVEKHAPKLAQDEPKKKHPGGRPPLFKTPEAMQEKIDAYFESCWVDKIIETTDKDGNVTASNVRYQNRPYTVMGLVLALGFCSRRALFDYSGKPEFHNTIKKARTKIEMNVEESLLEGKNAAGPIFWLKNNAEEKYKDKQELEHTGKDGGPIKTMDVTDEELLAIARGGGTRVTKKA